MASINWESFWWGFAFGWCAAWIACAILIFFLRFLDKQNDLRSKNNVSETVDIKKK